MSPYHVDPNVDYLRLQQLAEELTKFLTRMQAFYLDAVAGFAFVYSRIMADQTEVRGLVKGSDLESEEFQDTRLFSYRQVFSGPFCGSEHHIVTQGTAKARNCPGGTNFVTLGQVCIVALYDFWNEYLRREYVIAKGKLDRNEKAKKRVEQALGEHASHDLWGDIRHLRTSIVHNQGIAISDVARCKLVRWFQPGDSIHITPERMDRILFAVSLFRNQLFGEGFPKHYIQIPLGDLPGSDSDQKENE